MPLSQYEKVVSFDDVPDDYKDLVMVMLLDFLQLEVVEERGGDICKEAEVEVSYSIARRSDTD